MKDIQLSFLLKPFKLLFTRFHLTMFIVLVTACLGGAVVLLTSILEEASTDSTYTSPIEAGSIDQATLDRINALHTSDEEKPPTVSPTGRTNPFVE
jgi:hypothetical protein